MKIDFRLNRLLNVLFVNLILLIQMKVITLHT